MFCENCGKEIPDDAKFCPDCGAAVSSDWNSVNEEAISPENEAVNAEPGQEQEIPKPKSVRKKKETYAKDGSITGEKVTENIYLCPDGKYRWYYELDMIKNPTILFTVWKVLGMTFAIVGVVWLIVDLIQGIKILPGMELLGILFLVLCVLAIPAYLIVAAVFGWKYIVLFEMDEEQVSHIPTEKQFKKAQALNWLAMLTAIAAKNRGAFSAGMLAGTKGPSTSIFKEVEYLRIRRKRNTINVDYLFGKNPIYVEDADFDFVEKFIRDRCVKAKIR